MEITLLDRINAEILSYDGLMGIYINDFKGNVIEINADESFETASTIKTFILGCLYDEVEKGTKSLDDMLEYKPEHFVDGSGVLRSLRQGTLLSVYNMAVLMIIVSDNIATNILIDYLGIECINKFIQEQGFSATKLHNKLDFETYDQLGTTTPRDYASFFMRLHNGEIVSKQASEEMIKIFEQQHYNSMLTKYFPQPLIDEDTYSEKLISIASKSGSMNAARSDGGLISTPYGSYVIVLMNKNYHDPVYYPEHSATVFGAKISRLIFDQFMTLKGKIQ